MKQDQIAENELSSARPLSLIATDTFEGLRVSVASLVDDIHNVDCIELMRSMPSNSVSVVFADPPFNLSKKYLSYKDNLPYQEYVNWTQEWVAEAMSNFETRWEYFCLQHSKIASRYRSDSQ